MCVETRYMSSDRQIGNQGKLGFVPTSREIVEMELNLIDFSEIANNDYPINICDLSGGTGDQLHWMNSYLKELKINCSVFYNELSQERYQECVKNYPYMKTLNSDIFKVKVGTKNNRSLNKEVFSIIRNNPPYMYISNRDYSVRAEMEFYRKNTQHDIPGGIHIMELPIHQLLGIKNLLASLCAKYEIFIAKFPEEVYQKYKQVAVICKKKERVLPDKRVYEKNLYLLENELIPYLDAVTEKVIKVEKRHFSKSKNIDIFRNSIISDKTLKNGLDDVLENLIEVDKKTTKQLKNTEPLTSIIELLPGHISQLLASGMFDSIKGNLLIRGGANKILESSVSIEDGKEVTTYTEILKPFIELTNRKGEILYKDF